MNNTDIDKLNTDKLANNLKHAEDGADAIISTLDFLIDALENIQKRTYKYIKKQLEKKREQQKLKLNPSLEKPEGELDKKDSTEEVKITKQDDNVKVATKADNTDFVAVCKVKDGKVKLEKVTLNNKDYKATQKNVFTKEEVQIPIKSIVTKHEKARGKKVGVSI